MLSARIFTRVDAWPFWLAAWMTIVIVRGLGIASRYINHDAAWYLDMARVWLDGGRLYRDVVDTNPPLIVWLTTPPALAAQLLGAPEPLMFVLYVGLAIAVSLLTCARLLARTWPELPIHLRLTLVTLLLFLFFVAIHTEFGQREHFTTLLALPELYWPRWHGPRIARLDSGPGSPLGSVPGSAWR